MRLSVRLLVALGLVVPAALPGAAMAQGPVFADPLFAARHEVDTTALTRIGSAYACSVVSAPSAQSGRLLIFVTSAIGAQRAEAVRGELADPSRAEVRVVDRRFRYLTMKTIQRRALATRPRDMREVGLGEGKAFATSCPRVEIGIPPAGEASPAALRWARGLLRRFGSDRVVVRHRNPTAL